MTLQTKTDSQQSQTEENSRSEAQEEKVLCPHCLRTATNGKKCKGICVADNDY